MKNKTLKTPLYLLAITVLLSTVTTSGLARAATLSNTVIAPNLGVASTFGLLGQTISNSDPTFVSGDVGFGGGGETSPTTITNGSSYPNDAEYNNAHLALVSAISSANSQTPTSTGNLDISGQTLHPGVYAFSGAGNIVAHPDLTLSGAGVYIFQISGAFNTVAGTVITLANGAQACDIFWVVGGGTTLGANTRLEGTIMSAAAITVGANSTINGRILSETATTISTDTITVPPCANMTSTTGGTVTGSTDTTGSTTSTTPITPPTPPATVPTITPPAVKPSVVTKTKQSQPIVPGATSPVTGIPVVWELAEGFALVALGGLMTVLSRRRRRQ